MLTNFGSLKDSSNNFFANFAFRLFVREIKLSK